MFDTTLDTFVRANEQPLGGGWNATPIFDPGLTTLRIVSNKLANDAGGATSGQYWNTQFGPDIETWITIADNVLDESIYLYARAQSVGTASLDGYIMQAVEDGSRRLKLFVVTDGSTTPIGTNYGASGSWTVGDKVGIRVVGNEISAWWYDMSVGSPTWTQMIATNDSTYSGPGYCGAVIEGGTTKRWGTFGGGTVGAVMRRTGFLSAVGW